MFDKSGVFSGRSRSFWRYVAQSSLFTVASLICVQSLFDNKVLRRSRRSSIVGTGISNFTTSSSTHTSFVVVSSATSTQTRDECTSNSSPSSTISQMRLPSVRAFFHFNLTCIRKRRRCRLHQPPRHIHQPRSPWMLHHRLCHMSLLLAHHQKGHGIVPPRLGPRNSHRLSSRPQCHTTRLMQVVLRSSMRLRPSS